MQRLSCERKKYYTWLTRWISQCVHRSDYTLHMMAHTHTPVLVYRQPAVDGLTVPGQNILTFCPTLPCNLWTSGLSPAPDFWSGAKGFDTKSIFTLKIDLIILYVVPATDFLYDLICSSTSCGIAQKWARSVFLAEPTGDVHRETHRVAQVEHGAHTSGVIWL